MSRNKSLSLSLSLSYDKRENLACFISAIDRKINYKTWAVLDTNNTLMLPNKYYQMNVGQLGTLININWRFFHHKNE